MKTSYHTGSDHNRRMNAQGRRLPRRAGFSLIEVMVATTILVIIVIMVGMVFRQSTLSWQSGMSRADGNMLVRTVVGGIQRELRLAVDAREFGYTKAMDISMDSIGFVALLGNGSVPTRVELKSGTEVTRTAKPLGWNGNRWVEGSGESTILMSSEKGDVQPNLLFDFKPDPRSVTRLPLWVNLQARLSPAEGFRGVRAVSAGPDRVFDNWDDIEVR